MPGTTTTGTDGIISMNNEAGDGVVEVPCLRRWTLNANARFNAIDTRCMKSNDDGGSDSDLGWDEQEEQGKGWTLTLDFFWQITDEGAAPYLDLAKVGDQLAVILYPNLKTTGKPTYSGDAKIQSISLPAEIGDKMTQTVTCIGHGALTKGVAA